MLPLLPSSLAYAMSRIESPDAKFDPINLTSEYAKDGLGEHSYKCMPVCMPCILSGDTTTTVGRLGHHHNVQDELSTLFGEEYGNNDTGGGTSVDNTEMTMTTILYPIDRRRNVTDLTASFTHLEIEDAYRDLMASFTHSESKDALYPIDERLQPHLVPTIQYNLRN
jgi:hypothetical protein